MPPGIVAFMLAALMLTGCGQPRTTTQRKGRIINLTDTILNTGGSDTVRFGRLRSGEIAELHLWLANESGRTAVISSYERSCGCTSLSFDSEPIMPGEAQRIGLTFDSRGERGWQFKTLDIRFAGSQRSLRLFIEAEVE